MSMLHVYFTDVCLDLGFFRVQSFAFTKILQTHIHQTPMHCIYNIWKPATQKMRLICKEIRDELFSRINIALLHIYSTDGYPVMSKRSHQFVKISKTNQSSRSHCSGYCPDLWQMQIYPYLGQYCIVAL